MTIKDVIVCLIISVWRDQEIQGFNSIEVINNENSHNNNHCDFMYI